MRVAITVAAIALVSSPALSSPSCMTQSEARQKFPTAHLWWHGPNRCWDATPPSRRYLARRIKAKDPKPAQTETRAVRNAPEEKKSGWFEEPRWRQAMSKMQPDDMPDTRLSARATAGIDQPETPAAGTTWRDRWVDFSPRMPAPANKAGPADTLVDAGEPLVTPIRVMLLLLVLVLALGLFELLRRPARRTDWR